MLDEFRKKYSAKVSDALRLKKEKATNCTTHNYIAQKYCKKFSEV